jgi:hypothetical protein
MTPTPELRAQLRLLLDEVIPPDGTPADTLFSDAELDMLLQLSSSVDQAAASGWKLKAQRQMNPSAVVRAQFGSESFTFVSPKDLADFALAMAQRFAGNRAYALSICRPKLAGVASMAGSCRAGEGVERCMTAVCGDFSRTCVCWPSPCSCR